MIVVKGETEYMPFIKNTLKYSLIATGVIIVLATIAAYSVARKNFPGKDWFDALITIPIAIPGVVLGLGYLTLFGNTKTPSMNKQIELITLIIFMIIIGMLLMARKTPFGMTINELYYPKEVVKYRSEDFAKNAIFSLVSLNIFHITLVIINNLYGKSDYEYSIAIMMEWSLLTTLVIMSLGLIAALIIKQGETPYRQLLERFLSTPFSVPGIILGLMLLKLLGNTTSIGTWEIKWLTLNPFIFVPTILVFSYTIRKFPFTVRSVFSGLQQTDEVLEEAALNLGAGRLRTLFEITVPMIIMNVVAGALVSLVYCLTEVSTSLILISDTGTGTMTYKMAIESGDAIPVLCAMGVMLMVVQAVTLVVTNKLLQGRAEAMTGI
jgi:ABC-type Fe3+ transport system permease subunit